MCIWCLAEVLCRVSAMIASVASVVSVCTPAQCLPARPPACGSPPTSVLCGTVRRCRYMWRGPVTLAVRRFELALGGTDHPDINATSERMAVRAAPRLRLLQSEGQLAWLGLLLQLHVPLPWMPAVLQLWGRDMCLLRLLSLLLVRCACVPVCPCGRGAGQGCVLPRTAWCFWEVHLRHRPCSPTTQ